MTLKTISFQVALVADFPASHPLAGIGRFGRLLGLLVSSQGATPGRSAEQVGSMGVGF